MTNQPDLLPHIIEMKEAIARIDANVKDLPARVTTLEHAHTTLKAQVKTVGAIASIFGAVVSWVLSHVWKS